MRHSGRHTAAISRGRPLLLHSDRRGHRRSAPPGAQRSQVLRVESVGVLYLARESGCRALQCGGVRALRIAVVDAVVVAIESILAFLATTRDSSDAVTPACSSCRIGGSCGGGPWAGARAGARGAREAEAEEESVAASERGRRCWLGVARGLAAWCGLCAAEGEGRILIAWVAERRGLLVGERRSLRCPRTGSRAVAWARCRPIRSTTQTSTTTRRLSTGACAPPVYRSSALC